MNSDKPEIYCIDTSAFGRIQRFYPISVFPDLWEILEDLFQHKLIYPHKIVYDELVPKSGEKDEIANLIIKYESNFLPITDGQTKLIRSVLETFPKLIDPESEKEQADPWLIATLIEQMENDQLFGEKSLYVLVSEESERSPNKIPAVCKHFNIRHMNLFQFFNQIGVKFSVTRK